MGEDFIRVLPGRHYACQKMLRPESSWRSEVRNKPVGIQQIWHLSEVREILGLVTGGLRRAATSGYHLTPLWPLGCRTPGLPAVAPTFNHTQSAGMGQVVVRLT